MQDIVVQGAREHNLRNIDVRFPRDQITVVTGPSGSGKSTLAFDVIFAESQRRYVEMLSTHARRLLQRLPHPDVDRIEGLSPALGIRQFMPTNNPRSTVGTATEVLDYLRVLFAAVSVPYCPNGHGVLRSYTPPEIVHKILSLPEGQKLVVAAPIARGGRGDFKAEFEGLRRQGFARVRVDGAIVELQEMRALSEKSTHNIDIVIDRLSAKASQRSRINEAVELALKITKNSVVLLMQDEEERLYTELVCEHCDARLQPPSAQLFSFNDSRGACSACGGMGATVSEKACKRCQGARHGQDALSFRIGDHHLGSLAGLPLEQLRSVTEAFELPPALSDSMEPIVDGIFKRIDCLIEVGLGHLSLGRAAITLSAGESQRMRLATQIGSGLLGMLYVLDEPTAGLHPADVQALGEVLKRVRDRGNTLLVVDHDRHLVQLADHIIDLGPGAGEQGGRVVAQGRLQELDGQTCETLAYVRGQKQIDVPPVATGCRGTRDSHRRGQHAQLAEHRH